MISRITAFINFILSFLFSSEHTKNTFSSVPSVETIKIANAINSKIQVNLSTNILVKTISLFKYLEEQSQLLLAENETLSQNVQKFKHDNDSAQFEIQKLCTTVSCLETRIDESESKNAKLCTRNTILADKIKERESQKKALIEELGGAIGKEDLEYATWDLVLQTTKLLIQERDKVVKDNTELEQQNQLLTQTIQDLEIKISKLQFQANTLSISQNELLSLRSSIQNLEQENRNKNSRIQKLEQGNDRKDNYIQRLEQESRNKDSLIQRLEQDNHNKNSLIQSLKRGSSDNNERRIQSLEQKNNEMKSHIEKSEKSIQYKNFHIEKLEKDIQFKDSRIEKLEKDIQRLLEQIKILMVRDRENNCSPTSQQFTDVDYSLDVIDMYENLIDFIQANFSILELERIKEWVVTENFHHIIHNLCVISYILIDFIMMLENLVPDYHYYNYLGKNLYYCNKRIASELDVLLFIDNNKRINWIE